MSVVKIHLNRPAAWIEATGEDCLPFLQGQSSNDLNSLAPSPVTYTLWLDRKGKVLADSFVLQESKERVFLFSYHTPASIIMERLEAYIIADDVVLRDMTAQATSAAIWGNALPDVLARCGWERPDHGSFYHQDQLFLIPGRRSHQPNIDLIVASDDNQETIATATAAVLDAGGELVDENTIEQERIASCIPRIPEDVGPRDLPQEGHLEQAAISYTKGCYLGQEVMARIRSMGQVRRALVQVRVHSMNTHLPAPLYHEGREVGSLRTLARSGPRLGLALVRKDVLSKTRQLGMSPEEAGSIEITAIPNP